MSSFAKKSKSSVSSPVGDSVPDLAAKSPFHLLPSSQLPSFRASPKLVAPALTPLADVNTAVIHLGAARERIRAAQQASTLTSGGIDSDLHCSSEDVVPSNAFSSSASAEEFHTAIDSPQPFGGTAPVKQMVVSGSSSPGGQNVPAVGVVGALPPPSSSSAEFDLSFQAPVSASSIVPEYSELIFPSTDPQSRFFTPIRVAELQPGMCIPILDSNSSVLSFSAVIGALMIYTVVSKSGDKSCDLVAIAGKDAAMNSFPTWATFLESDASRRVLIFSDSAIATRQIPATVYHELATYGLTPIGSAPFIDASSFVTPPSSAAPAVPPAVREPSDKERLKADALRIITRACNNDLDAVTTFMGPSKDYAHDGLLARIYNMADVHTMAIAVMLPNILPVFLVFRWGQNLLTFVKTPLQCHLRLCMPLQRNGQAFRFQSVDEMEEALINLGNVLNLMFCSPGSATYAFDPLYYPNSIAIMLSQIRCRTPGLCVRQIHIDYLLWQVSIRISNAMAEFADERNATLSLHDFRAKLVASLDLNPAKLVLDAIGAERASGNIPAQLPVQVGPSLVAVVPVAAKPLQSIKRPAPRNMFPTSGHPPYVRARHAYSGPHHAPPPGVPSVPQGTSTGRPSFICFQDFVSKLDRARFPLGCTSSSCSRRHVPLPAPGAFAAADKAEILQSIARSKGNPNLKAAMTAAVSQRV